jgi:hypothetical protein
VIPEHWSPVRRPDDDELVGYLVADGGRGVVPTTLVGTPLGDARPADAARAVLVERGLRALDRRWWCRLPGALPAGLTDATRPGEDWHWRPVVLVEAAPDGARVRPEWPAPEELGGQAALPVPVGDLLRGEVPDGPSAGSRAERSEACGAEGSSA